MRWSLDGMAAGRGISKVSQQLILLVIAAMICFSYGMQGSSCGDSAACDFHM